MIEGFNSLQDAWEYLHNQGFRPMDKEKLNWISEATRAYVYTGTTQTASVEYKQLW